MVHPARALAGAVMRGADETSGLLFSYVYLEARIPARQPLRKIRQVVNDALAMESFQPKAADTPPDDVLGNWPQRRLRTTMANSVGF